MDIFIYSDESGVFDKAHNNLFVFGGLVFLSKESKDIEIRKYLHAERQLTLDESNPAGTELKACRLSHKNKGKLFRSLNGLYRFGVVIDQRNVMDQIFRSKKDKQRYLDYAYKISVKRVFEKMLGEGIFCAEDVSNLHFFVDEHTTATNGKYELRESLEQEFKNGTYNLSYSRYCPPIFPKLSGVQVSFCNSEQKPLIRASDIVAIRLLYLSGQDDWKTIHEKFYCVTRLP